MSIRFDGQVAIVTGAGNGLGRSHALELAARGAKIVVNDLGGSLGGEGGSLSAADKVVQQIIAAGGEAIANGANVTDKAQVDAMVASAMQKWGQVDILVNNAGILRDKSYANMDIENFKTVIDVHLMGSANCTKAVWGIMRDQKYGRIVMTSSSSGLYGNFGQTNYGAAKMAVVGMMNTLHLEGAKYNIHVNSLAPAAATRMTEDLFSEAVNDLMTVESVSAALVYLAHEDAPSGVILCAGAGVYAATRIYETEGVFLPPAQQTPENIAANIDQILNGEGQAVLAEGGEQVIRFVNKAAKALGIKLEKEEE
ncbi:MAG: SDR family NAD(P)-dependent oxidoreductase [Alphaproteobacteria bacterium]|nr:SDR family NAD(P)-dependent oxidoreductase [Alphaproteobacteria bacterium]